MSIMAVKPKTSINKITPAIEPITIVSTCLIRDDLLEINIQPNTPTELPYLTDQMQGTIDAGLAKLI